MYKMSVRFLYIKAEIKKVKWLNIFIFYLLAFLIAAPFNSGFLVEAYRNITKNYLISSWGYLPAGFGTLVGTLIVLWLDKKHEKTITLLGNAPFKNITIAIIPLIVFTIIGLKNELLKNEHYYAFIFMVINLAYALAEEIGWRGYLQDALRPISSNFRYIFIGIFWWVWHFRFCSTFEITLFPVICITSAFILGKFVEQTKSSFTVAGLHSLIIILTNTGKLSISKITGAFITILIWFAIGYFFKLNENKKPAK